MNGSLKILQNMNNAATKPEELLSRQAARNDKMRKNRFGTTHCTAMIARMSPGSVEPTGVVASSPRHTMIMPIAQDADRFSCRAVDNITMVGATMPAATMLAATVSAAMSAKAGTVSAATPAGVCFECEKRHYEEQRSRQASAGHQHRPHCVAGLSAPHRGGRLSLAIA
jgi:uncharacterized phage protein gp47/JayE